MHKFPYIVDYVVGGDQVEIKVAEELLKEYEDFYLYNRTQYSEVFKKYLPEGEMQNDGDDGDAKLLELRKLRAEQNAKAAVDHWAKLFRSMDFAQGSLLGIKIDWDALQQILLEELKSKIHPTDSSMNFIAPPLRKLCSILLFNYELNETLSKIEKRGKCAALQIDEARKSIADKTNDLLTKLAKGDLLGVTVAEYHKSKSTIIKIKTPEAIINFVGGM